jgi:hypothetical protein
MKEASPIHLLNVRHVQIETAATEFEHFGAVHNFDFAFAGIIHDCSRADEGWPALGPWLNGANFRITTENDVVPRWKCRQWVVRPVTSLAHTSLDDAWRVRHPGPLAFEATPVADPKHRPNSRTAAALADSGSGRGRRRTWGASFSITCLSLRWGRKVSYVHHTLNV